MSVREHFDIAGELLLDSWKDYVSNFPAIVAVSIAATAPFIIANLAIVELIDPELKNVTFDIILQAAAAILLYIPLQALGAATLYRLFDFKRKGEAGGLLLKSLRMGWRKYFTALITFAFASLLILAAMLLAEFAATFILVVIMFVASMLSLASSSAVKAGAFVIFGAGMLAQVCATCWIAAKLSLSMPACVFEGWGPLRSVIRSFVMTAGSFWILLMSFAAPLIVCAAISAALLFLESAWLCGIPCVLAAIAVYSFITVVAYRAYLRLSGEE